MANSKLVMAMMQARKARWAMTEEQRAMLKLLRKAFEAGLPAFVVLPYSWPGMEKPAKRERKPRGESSDASGDNVDAQAGKVGKPTWKQVNLEGKLLEVNEEGFTLDQLEAFRRRPEFKDELIQFLGSRRWLDTGQGRE